MAGEMAKTYQEVWRLNMELKEIYLKQIQMLEKAQEEALSKGDMKKVEDLAISIVSISNTIKSLQ
jgi:hypothetical protein